MEEKISCQIPIRGSSCMMYQHLYKGRLYRTKQVPKTTPNSTVPLACPKDLTEPFCATFDGTGGCSCRVSSNGGITLAAASDEGLVTKGSMTMGAVAVVIFVHVGRVDVADSSVIEGISVPESLFLVSESTLAAAHAR